MEGSSSVLEFFCKNHWNCTIIQQSRKDFIAVLRYHDCKYMSPNVNNDMYRQLKIVVLVYLFNEIIYSIKNRMQSFVVLLASKTKQRPKYILYKAW